MFSQGGGIIEALRQYIISVVAAALLCSLVTGVMPGGRAKQIIKVVCGLFLAYTVLQGLTGMEWRMPSLTDIAADDARQAAALGESLGEDAMAQIIMEQTQAYILDKAAALGLALEAEVTLDENLVPQAVTLMGQAAPYERRQLQSAIALELGIPKERQQWIP